MRYIKMKEEDWNYLVSKINVGASFFDARAFNIFAGRKEIIEEPEGDEI